MRGDAVTMVLRRAVFILLGALGVLGGLFALLILAVLGLTALNHLLEATYLWMSAS